MALAGVGGRLGRKMRTPARCYSAPAYEACPGVPSASPQLPPPLSPHRRGLEEGRAQAPQPFLTTSPSCSETEEAFNMGWGEGPWGPSLPTKGSISVRTGFPLAP